MDDVVQHSIVMQVVVVVVIKHDNHDDYNDNRETPFSGETHIRSTFPGWAQYGRDDRAQMRHQVGQLYVFFNIIITKMRSDFALLRVQEDKIFLLKYIFFHRNPELFHGFVLNGPLIVPGFQVVCLKEERCIK